MHTCIHHAYLFSIDPIDALDASSKVVEQVEVPIMVIVQLNSQLVSQLYICVYVCMYAYLYVIVETVSHTYAAYVTEVRKKYSLKCICHWLPLHFSPLNDFVSTG
jgi:hypothetical protein